VKLYRKRTHILRLICEQSWSHSQASCYSPPGLRLYNMNILHIRFVDLSKSGMGLMLHITFAVWCWMPVVNAVVSLYLTCRTGEPLLQKLFIQNNYCSMRWYTNIQKYPMPVLSWQEKSLPQTGPLGAVWRGLLIRWVIRRRITRWDHIWPYVTGSRLGIIRQSWRVRKQAGTL